MIRNNNIDLTTGEETGGQKINNHNHDGIGSVKIKPYNVIPSYVMTNAQLTYYLSRPAIEGDIFTVYISDIDEYRLYYRLNKQWNLSNGDISLGSVASDTLQYSLDTERTANGNNSNAVCKTIMINAPGTVRVKWDSHATSGYSGQHGYLQLNGTTIQSSGNETTYTTFTTDVTVSFGDELSLKGEYIGSSNYIRYFRNFRIYYTPTIITNQTILDQSV